MPHDVAGVAGQLHGGAVQLAGLLALHQGAGLHVGGAVGHVEGQRVVAGGRAALRRLPEPSSAVGEPNLAGRDSVIAKTEPQTETDLYPGLTELGPLAELLPGVDVRVLGPLEGLLQLVQLVGREGGAGPPLLPLQRDPGLGLGVRALLRTLGFD